jgi:outer membrane protein assembly factor BamB
MKNPQRVGSGVLIGGHVYILNENGVAWCIEAASGEITWQERLGGTSWCSTLAADGRLYASNTEGQTFVIEPDPEKCVLVATNNLNETMRASPAVSDGAIFLRTYDHLWCIEAAR